MSDAPAPAFTRLEVFLIVAVLVTIGFSIWTTSRMPPSKLAANCPLPADGERLVVNLVTDGKGGLEVRCVAARGRTK